MNTKNNYQFIILIAVLALIVAILLVFYRKLISFYESIKKNIHDSVEPKFIDVSTSTSNLTDLAIEVWRLGKRLEKISDSISDDQRKALDNSYVKLQRFLDKNDVETIDYTGKKHNEGLNLEILAVEKSADLKETIIKETHEPAIMLKGRVIRKAKVILLEPENE